MRPLVAFVAAQVGVGLVLVCQPAQAQVSRGAGVIVNKGTGKCLNVVDASTTNRAGIVQYTCEGSPNSDWTLVPHGGANTYRIIAKHSGKCLNVPNSAAAEGTQIEQYDCTDGAANELWTIEPFGSSPTASYRIRAKHNGMCLNVDGSPRPDIQNYEFRNTNGVKIIQWPCVGADNELWNFSDTVLPSWRDVHVVSQNSGMCANVFEGSTSALAKIVQYPCGQNPNEKWRFVRRGAGFEIRVRLTNMCLEVENGSGGDGAQIVQNTCNGASKQIWSVKAASGSAFTIENVSSKKCLDTWNASTAVNEKLVQWGCAGTSSQRWRLSDEEALGAWSPLVQLPLVPVAAATLRTGKVLMWAAYDPFTFQPDQAAKTVTAIVDPTTKHITPGVANTQHDMFCPGTSMLPDGRLLVNGGVTTRETSIFNPADGKWLAAAKMEIGRGYNANTVTESGKVFTIGGSWKATGDERPDPNGFNRNQKKNGELWNGASWVPLSGATAEAMT